MASDKGGAEKTQDSTALFNRTLESWKTVDLPTLQRKLDAQAVTFQDYQRDSLNGRKNLAKKTKEFRHEGSTHSEASINQLVKEYQKTIDGMAKRNKKVSQAFFSVYRAIAEAPDPTQALEVGSESLKENGDESSKDDGIDWKQREEEWEKRSQKLENECGRLRKEVKRLEVRGEMMGLKLKKQEAALGGLDDDVDSTGQDNSECKKLKVQVVDLERNNQELRREVASLRSEKHRDKPTVNDTKRVKELESENAVLVSRLERERKELEDHRNKTQGSLDSQKKEIQELKASVSTLKQYESKAKDYDEVSKELQMLQEVIQGGKDGDTKAPSVDIAMAQRNKKLNDEIIQYRSKNEDLDKKVKELEASTKQLSEELDASKQMNTKLEADMDEMEDATTGDRWEAMSEISSVAGGKTGSLAGSLVSRPIEGSVIDSEQNTSLLPIIAQQRDRFRTKNKQLEAEAKRQFTKMAEFKREVESLRADNQDLYEKIRFIESARKDNNVGSLVDDPEVDAVEARYRQSYETKLHPIEKFRRMETRRINSRMSPFERVFVQVTRLILSTKYTRWMFVFYCIGLHLLILILTLFMMTEASAEIPDDQVLSGSTGGNAHGVVSGAINAGMLPENE